MTGIEWTDATWNPVRGCSRVSEGCRNCYAERQAARFLGDNDPFHGFAYSDKSGPHWTGRVELIPSKLEEPLHWRKPRRVFVNSMSDLFHERLSDEDILRVLGVVRRNECRDNPHTMQVLTKRPGRMASILSRLQFDHAGAGRLYLDDRGFARDGSQIGFARQLKHLWIGVSVEDQATADERIPLLLQTPSALRFVSYEPALGPVDFRRAFGSEGPRQTYIEQLDWLVIGGESGPGARPCDLAWIRAAVEQCRGTGVPVFVKQLGARPKEDGCEAGHVWIGNNPASLQRIRHPKGGSMGEWPEDLRVREFPGGV